MSLDPNDPKLTAYALGELDDKERVAVEAELAKSEDARRAVEEIRRTAALLEQELQNEPAIALSQEQRQTIESEAAKSNGAWHAEAPDGWHAQAPAKPGRRHVNRARIKHGGAALGHATRPFWRRILLPTSLAASLVIVASLVIPSLLRSREAAKKLAVANDMKGVGVSSKEYAIPTADAMNGLHGRPLSLMFFADGHATFHRTGHGPVSAMYNEHISNGYEVPHSGHVSVQATGAFAGEALGAADDYSYSRWLPNQGFVGPGAADADVCNTEAYDRLVDNPFLEVTQHPLSTFSIDVDTASYSNVRRFLNGGRLPPKDAVRIEEMINYFSYDYALPVGGDPFSVDVAIAECPWEPDHLLARIGLKGMEIAEEERPQANLVFLLDVSGSMAASNKLPLVRESLRLLVESLLPDDRVAIVVYAGASGLVLESTSCDEKASILSALDRLQAGGSTNGGEGIQLAYDVAGDYFSPEGINRVILATDGDFNVGVTNQGDLTRLIEEKAKTGVFLSVLGFGMGNYQDSTLEKLADQGNGNYAYIDTINEARKVLVEQLNGTLVTIAKDVKIQIEFNPAEVAAYRLIGYENRVLQAQDFNDDAKDAGEIGAGHTVTALYELIPAGELLDEIPTVDPLKYQAHPEELTEAADSGETMTVKLRYKEPDGDTSRLIEFPVTDTGMALADAPDAFIFAASVASFGMLLRDSPHKGSFTYAAAVELARESQGPDEYGYRAEFIGLVEKAGKILESD